MSQQQVTFREFRESTRLVCDLAPVFRKLEIRTILIPDCQDLLLLKNLIYLGFDTSATSTDYKIIKEGSRLSIYPFGFNRYDSFQDNEFDLSIFPLTLRSSEDLRYVDRVSKSVLAVARDDNHANDLELYFSASVSRTNPDHKSGMVTLLSTERFDGHRSEGSE